jgi:hypothetical protein
MSEEIIRVEAQSDHFETLSRIKKPIIAIQELIWNGLDADASDIFVKFKLNGLDAIDEIIIEDNGHGLNIDEARDVFKKLGGSWKKYKAKSKTKKRILHGRLGKGRFRAFALGNEITWRTVFADDNSGKRYEYSIIGEKNSIGTFRITKLVETQCLTGTSVSITGFSKNYPSLQTSNTIEELNCEFALYLQKYKNIRIKYNQELLNPASMQNNIEDVPLEVIDKNKKFICKAQMTVIEWTVNSKHMGYLCDEDGITIHEFDIPVRTPGYNFTAHVSAPDLLLSSDKDDELLFDLKPELHCLVDCVKDKIKSIYRKQEAEKASNLVQQWKSEKVYPYDDSDLDILKDTERQIFDICAFNIHNYLPEFDQSDSKSKKITFSLLKNAIETNPTLIRKVVSEILELPKEKQNDLEEILEKTSLDAIITASKVVTDRLDFIRGLEILIFDKLSKQQLLERKQLHRILAEQSWFFGEEYNLTSDDENLRDVLKKHIKKLGQEEIEILDPVLRPDGKEGIVDLVLGRTISLPHADQHENIVIELKRPNVPISDEVLTQIDKYANAVIADERFDKAKTKWKFVAISNKITADVIRKANQQHLPKGCVYDYSPECSVWVMEWNEIINDCKARLNFYKERLDYDATRESAIEYLRKTHDKYLPSCIKEENDEPVDSEKEEDIIETIENTEEISQSTLF